MSWFEQVMNWIDWFFNKPLPIVGVSLCVVLIFVWKLFKNSSFGKKQIKEAKEKAQKAEEKAENTAKEFEIKVKEIEEQANNKVKALESFYETCLAQKQAKEDELENLVVKICGSIHNADVKKYVNEYKQKISSSQTIMTQKINEVKADYETRIKALEDEMYGKIKKAENSCPTEE